MAIQPVQQFNYTSGKNSTDSALIIDTMDLLHVGVVEGFALIARTLSKRPIMAWEKRHAEKKEVLGGV